MTLLERYALWLYGVALIAAFIVLVVVLGGCPGPTQVLVVEKTRYCLTKPPPAIGPWQEGITAHGEGRCPGDAGIETCLSRSSAVILGTYLYEVRGWAETAWSRCRAQKDGGP